MRGPHPSTQPQTRPGTACNAHTLPHPRTPVRGSPDQTPNTDLVRSPSRLRVRPTACPHARHRQSTGSPVAGGRSRAGKPELPSFVSIRVHSWFKTPPFASIRGSKHPHSPPFVVQIAPQTTQPPTAIERDTRRPRVIAACCGSLSGCRRKLSTNRYRRSRARSPKVCTDRREISPA